MSPVINKSSQLVYKFKISVSMCCHMKTTEEKSKSGLPVGLFLIQVLLSGLESSIVLGNVYVSFQ